MSKSNLKSGLLGCCWAGSSPKPPASDVPISCHRVILKVRLKSSKVNPSLPKSERQTLGAGADGPQLATYPQSPFSGPVRCCDVTDLYQAFSQRTGPGRLWISLGADSLLVLSGQGQTATPKPNPAIDTIPKLRLLLRDARIRPAVNEMEIHPHFQQTELVDFLRANDILPIGYSPLGSPNRPGRDRSPEDSADMDDPVIADIARRHATHPAAICIKWAVQRGVVPIPMSTKRSNYVANLDAVGSEPLDSSGIEPDRRYRPQLPA